MPNRSDLTDHELDLIHELNKYDRVDRVCTMIEGVAPIIFGIFFIAMLAIVCIFR